MLQNILFHNSRIKDEIEIIPDAMINPAVEENQQQHGNKNRKKEAKPIDVISFIKKEMINYSDEEY